MPDDWIASENQDIHGTRFDDTHGATRSQSLRMGLGDPPGRYVLSTVIAEGAGGFGLEPTSRWRSRCSSSSRATRSTS